MRVTFVADTVAVMRVLFFLNYNKMQKAVWSFF